jgi:non-ribosomal peptide synthetase component E (peptide arylation enzyme)
MISESILNPRRESMKTSGFWIDKTMDDFMSVAVAASPNKEALIAYRHDQSDSQRFTYRELSEKLIWLHSPCMQWVSGGVMSCQSNFPIGGNLS